MGEALFWGLLAGSSLVIGGALALAVDLSRRTLGRTKRSVLASRSFAASTFSAFARSVCCVDSRMRWPWWK